MLLINPKLYYMLTNHPVPETETHPTSALLPGQFAHVAAEQLNKMSRFFRRNRHLLTCEQCGHREKYNIGQPLLDYSLVDRSKLVTQEMTVMDKVQFPFYFRCVHCNGAGEWKWSDRLEKSVYLGALGNTENPDDPSIPLNGESRLFDDYKPKWATSGEDYMLDLIQKDRSNADLWYKLGNLYYKSHRADLAAAVLEKAVELNPWHTEALYTLAQLLDTIDLKASHFYFHQVLLTVGSNKEMDIYMLRDVAAHSLWELESIYMESEESLPLFPSAQEAEGIADSPLHDFLTLTDEEKISFLNGSDVNAKTLESFYPLAEMFLTEQKEELSSKDQTFHHILDRATAEQKKENLEEYKRIRSAGMKLNADIFSYLIEQNGPQTMREISRFLNISFDKEDTFDQDVMTDFAIYEYDWDGQTPVQRYNQNHTESEERQQILEAANKAWSSLFYVKNASNIDGTVLLEDLIHGEEVEIIDNHFSATVDSDELLLYTRILPFSAFNITSGISFLFSKKDASYLLKQWEKQAEKREQDTVSPHCFKVFYRLYQNSDLGLPLDFQTTK
ncbi:tetratricopeptide repeat protein [Salibacterium salarium]|uniref:Tetratricopeptide repeat protein n=1 Tax=Salibacterium salarium TaxID=284579 RepID=A0A428N6N0_9BACI|nr:tetratricopeptide repeat protein [Salibacterium salarium]RSL34061.1 tetratricopeptide repeat protein [Salibacterium salarium]